MGGVGRAAPVWHGNVFQKTGARSARARTRGQNPLVVNRQHVNQTTAEAEFLNVTGQQAYEFSSLLFTVT
jgi:hypothetical protein